jgi:hypothetical protein
MCRRGISYADVTTAVMTGEIIEEYPDDYPFPSCLLLSVAGEKPIHVVCGTNFEVLYFITAYQPNSDEWETGWKTRKEKKS